MSIRLILGCCILLFFSPLLKAEEFQLNYEKAVSGPFSFFMLSPSDGNATTWKNGQDILTARAVTYDFYIPFMNTGRSRTSHKILSMDKSAEDAKYPDTLFIDLNGNRTIDENERFLLKQNTESQFSVGSPYHDLIARKVPFPCGGDDGKEVLLLNLHCLIQTTDTDMELGTLFSVSAWGCLQGKVTLDGKSYNVTLFDQAINGSFGDFGKEGSYEHDMLSLIPEDQDSSGHGRNDMKPLRRKMVIAGNAYAVEVEGKSLKLNPISVEYGMVSAAGKDMTLTLSNPEWGDQPIESGEKKSLPVGTWTLRDFRCQEKSTGPVCFYSGPPDMKIDITSGNTDTLELDTALNAKVTCTKQNDTINMSLALTTSQGAKFQSYYGGQKETERFDGIPFKICDSSGTTVHEAKFTFG